VPKHEWFFLRATFRGFVRQMEFAVRASGCRRGFFLKKVSHEKLVIVYKSMHDAQRTAKYLPMQIIHLFSVFYFFNELAVWRFCGAENFFGIKIASAERK
jgi:hypothetical protein